MGWWPFGGSPSTSADKASTTASSASNSAPPLLPPTTTPDPATKARTRDEQADAELNAFLASLEGNASPHPHFAPPNTSTTTPAQFPPSPTTSSSSSSATDQSATPDASSGKLDISPYALRPRTMSCRQAFDQAFYCSSLGGKFNDIYRFGSLQPCSEQWDAFWFCMRTKSYGQEKGEIIAQYYEEREKREMARRSEGRSSEDVWELRTEPVEKAFWKVP